MNNNNLTSLHEIVNTFSQGRFKEIWDRSEDKYLMRIVRAAFNHKQIKKFPPFMTPLLEEEEAKGEIKTELKVEQNNCPENVPAVDAKNPIPARERRKNHARAAIYEQILKLLEEGNLSEKRQRHYLKLLKNFSRFITIENDDGSLTGFTGMQKGERGYNISKSIAIKKSVGYWTEKGYVPYLATLTLDFNGLGLNRAEAWKQYPDLVEKVKDYLRVTFGAKYAGFMESTKIGYPHIHLVLLLPPEYKEMWEKAKVKKEIKSGPLYEALGRQNFCSQYNLQKADVSGAMNYVLKYVEKYTQKDIYALITKPGKWEKEERKAVQSYLYTSAAKVRQFSRPDYPEEETEETKAKEAEPFEKTEDNISGPVDFSKPFSELTDEDAARERCYLMKVVLSRKTCSMKSVKACRLQDAEDATGLKVASQDDLTQEQLQKISKTSKYITCGGCFIGHLHKYLSTWEDEHIMELCTPTVKGGLYFELPKKNDTDKEFMRKVGLLMGFYGCFSADVSGRFIQDWCNPLRRKEYGDLRDWMILTGYKSPVGYARWLRQKWEAEDRRSNEMKQDNTKNTRKEETPKTKGSYSRNTIKILAQLAIDGEYIEQ